MKIAVDTAILIRANSKAAGPARELLQAIQDSGSQLILSPYVLAEVDRVLRYPRIQNLYHLSDRDICAYLHDVESYAEMVVPAQDPPIVLKDANDDPVVYTALAGQADVLCTMDKHFYEPNVLAFCSRQGIQLMTDVELLRFLRQLIPGS